jgi:hypothetical protein
MFTRDTLENPVHVKLAVVYILEILASIIIFYVADKRKKLNVRYLKTREVKDEKYTAE